MRRGQGVPQVRRAHALVGYWRDGHYWLENYLAGTAAQVAPVVAVVLQAAGGYVSRPHLARRFEQVPEMLDLIAQMVDLRFLLEKGSGEDRRDRALDSEWAWGQAARFFHCRTQVVEYEPDMARQRASVVELARRHHPPSPYKDYKGQSIRLPHDDPRTEFWQCLAARRTRRAFRRSAISASDFARVLQWTWGRTGHVDNQDLGPYLLKTSPSGGARHPIEVYPVVLNVAGIDPGIYHYSVRRHALTLRRSGSFRSLVVDLFAKQPWVRNASAAFLMTAVVGRSMWKYRHDHAYRVLLLDAGHLGQTFHLICTQLGLAPFTSSAKNDRLIETTLGLDGITELSIYAAACGVPAAA